MPVIQRNTSVIEARAAEAAYHLQHGDSFCFFAGVVYDEDLYARFVLNPDLSGDGFDAKFRRQLAGAPAAVYQLSGELIFVHLLIATGNIGGQAKRSLINRVLSC